MSRINKGMISGFSGVESSQPRERISLAIWSLSGIAIAACSNQNKFIEVPPDPSREPTQNGGEGAVSGFRIQVLDGPLQDADVYVDINGDGVHSADELIVSTDRDGFATLDVEHAGRAVIVDVSGSLDVLTHTIVSPDNPTIYRALSTLPQTLPPTGSISALLITPLTELLASQSTTHQATLDSIFGTGVISVDDILDPDNYNPGATSIEAQAISRAALALTELAGDSTLTVTGTAATASNLAKLQALFASFSSAGDEVRATLEGTAHAIDSLGDAGLAEGTLTTAITDRVDRGTIPSVYEPNDGEVLEGVFAGPTHVIFSFEDALMRDGITPIQTDIGKARELFGFEDPLGNPGGVTSQLFGIFIKATTSDTSVQIHYNDIDAENPSYWELLSTDQATSDDFIDLNMVAPGGDDTADFHYVSFANFVNLAIVNLNNAASAGEVYSFEYYVWDGQSVSLEAASLSIRIAGVHAPVFGAPANSEAGITETDGNDEVTPTGVTFTMRDLAGRGVLPGDAHVNDFSVSDSRFAVERVGVMGENFRLVLKAGEAVNHENPLGTGVNHALNGEIPITITYDNPADTHAAITISEVVTINDLDEVSSFASTPYEATAGDAESRIDVSHVVTGRIDWEPNSFILRNDRSADAQEGTAVPESDSRYGRFQKMLEGLSRNGEGVLGTIYYSDSGGAYEYVINTETPETVDGDRDFFYGQRKANLNSFFELDVGIRSEATRPTEEVILTEKGQFTLEADEDDPSAVGFSTTFEVVTADGDASRPSSVRTISENLVVNQQVIGDYGVLFYHDTDGSWEYAPNLTTAKALREGETRPDVFTITAVSSDGVRNEGTNLTITVVGANDLPYAHEAFSATNPARKADMLVNMVEGGENIIHAVNLGATGNERGHLEYLDHESPTNKITYLLTSIPTGEEGEGVTIHFNDSDFAMKVYVESDGILNGVNSFTQKDINDGRVKLRQDGTDPNPDGANEQEINIGHTSFEFIVQDEHGGEVEGELLIHVLDVQ